MQLRESISTPLPQDTLHGFAVDQLDHPPSTEMYIQDNAVRIRLK